jgi:tryptophan synthase alpha chain
VTATTDDADLSIPPAPAEPGALEAALVARRAAGHKLLVPYVTGGLDDEWTQVMAAIADAGADAVEVGIPFSDPVMDGPVIQAASERALAVGATPVSILDDVQRLEVDIPLAVMTYFNIAYRMGLTRFGATLAESGVAAAILPDLPLEELGPWARAADATGVETVLLAAPTGSDERLGRVCERARGFVYAVGLLGVTGERTDLAESAVVIARRLKALTDKPVLVGVGVSNAEQAVEVCEVADGVVIGSALVRRLLDGEGPTGAAAFVGSVRRALDAG